jgi:uncharacterized protein
MQTNTLRSFKQKLRYNKISFKRFVTKIENKPPKNLDAIAGELEKEVWAETDCLTCANCCKVMTPTFTTKDMKRIAAHLEMSVDAFKEKWLKFEPKDKDWVNKKQPCQFLNLKDNKCSIYEVRPESCSGFPHLTRKQLKLYIHLYKQNVEYCPATYAMVEKMMAKLNG